jgi:hypothetical protein
MEEESSDFKASLSCSGGYGIGEIVDKMREKAGEKQDRGKEQRNEERKLCGRDMLRQLL